MDPREEISFLLVNMYCYVRPICAGITNSKVTILLTIWNIFEKYLE